MTVVFTEFADILSNNFHETIHLPGKLQQQADKTTLHKEPIFQVFQKISSLAQWVLTAISTLTLKAHFPVEQNDLFILCSDGLSGTLSDEEIAIFASGLPLEDATAAVVGLALVRGAPDNTTVILAKAGPEEVTHYSRREASWPLEDDGGSIASQRLPWIFLGIAAASFFLCLVAYSAYQSSNEGNDFLRRMFLAGSIITMGLTLGSVFGSFFSFANIKPRKKTKAISPGRGTFLGKAPYRHYNSTPSEKIFDRIIRSLDHAQNELSRQQLHGGIAETC